MKIELRNVKHSAFASEETQCFEAAIYVDGKKAGHASNAGKGGMTDVWPRELEQRITAYAATLPPLDLGEGYKPAPQDAESVIDGLLHEWLLARDLKRALSGRILFVRGGELRQTGKLAAEVLASNLKRSDLREVLKADAVLNLLPQPEALALYKTAGAP